MMRRREVMITTVDFELSYGHASSWTDRERQRQTDRQTNKNYDDQTDRKTDRLITKDIFKWSNGHATLRTDKDRQRQTKTEDEECQTNKKGIQTMTETNRPDYYNRQF